MGDCLEDGRYLPRRNRRLFAVRMGFTCTWIRPYLTASDIAHTRPPIAH